MVLINWSSRNDIFRNLSFCSDGGYITSINLIYEKYKNKKNRDLYAFSDTPVKLPGEKKLPTHSNVIRKKTILTQNHQNVFVPRTLIFWCSKSKNNFLNRWIPFERNPNSNINLRVDEIIHHGLQYSDWRFNCRRCSVYWF